MARYAGFMVLFGLIAVSSSAHMRMLDPAPRSDASGLTLPPCGGLPAGPTTATWQPGAEVVVELEIVISHVGQRLVLSASVDGDQTFVEVDEPVEPHPGSIPYQSGGIPAPTVDTYAIAIRLPDSAAESATLQGFDSVSYYSCADVVLSNEIFADGFETGSTDGWSSVLP